MIDAKIGHDPPERSADPKRPVAGRPNGNDTYKVTVGDAYTKGPDTAKVTIVEWSDFQCPFCDRVNPTLDQLARDYGDDLRLAFKHNPLPMHDRALAGALAAEAAGRQGKFWEMHELCFEHGRALTDDNFRKWAGELGLDVETFERDMLDPALGKKIAAQQRQGVTLGARGTPAFFINGRFLSGAQPVHVFKQVIDEELEKAAKLIAAGTPPEAVYAKTIANGKTSV